MAGPGQPTRRFGAHAPKLARLRQLSDDDLVEAYDERAENSIVGTDFYLQEIRSREMARVNASMLQLTRWIAAFTFIVTAATILNVWIAWRGL